MPHGPRLGDGHTTAGGEYDSAGVTEKAGHRSSKPEPVTYYVGVSSGPVT